MPDRTQPMIELEGVAKAFVMHLQGGTRLQVLAGVSFAVRAGECVVLGGPSGIGKSSLLRMIYGNYRCDAGAIRVRDAEASVDVAAAPPRRILRLRRSALAYVSQFLRVIPRVAALDLVTASAREHGVPEDRARERARSLLQRLKLPEHLWSLPPATFSGGEQQRINIARGFVAEHPILLLDEPTASLDAANREAVIGLIAAKKAAGAAILGIFHDEEVRDRVADRIIDLTQFAAEA